MNNARLMNRRLSIAPMMAYSDRHYRMLMRQITSQTLLYTEMITTGAIIHGDRDYLLGYSPEEHPLAIQLGGSDPNELALSAKIAEDYGYAEVNLNVGCPSDRVQAGRIGACLMKEPLVVADAVAAMQAAVKIPVTIKTRLGVDEFDSYEYCKQFIAMVAAAGCKTFIIHARKAWLKGLSPRENRDVPPLQYDRVYRLKKEMPELEIVINGGIKTVGQMHEHLRYVDGVMIGREAYSNPFLFSTVDQDFFAIENHITSVHEIVLKYLPYVAHELQRGVPLRHLTCHLLGLFQGMPGARQWRRYLTENSGMQRGDVGVIERALTFIGNS